MIASICLQNKIKADLIDELTASFKIGDWKDEHFQIEFNISSYSINISTLQNQNNLTSSYSK